MRGGKPVGFGESASLVVRELSPGVEVARESVVTATVLGFGFGFGLGSGSGLGPG